MTQTHETLQRRSKTLTSIRGIVHTMKTLSAINAVPYEHAAEAIVAYHQTILDGLRAYLHYHGTLSVHRAARATPVVVVFGSDHGLCGGYNESLATAVARHLATLNPAGAEPRVLCVGAQMQDALRGHDIRPAQLLLPPASAEGIGRLAADIATRLDRIRYQAHEHEIEVALAYTRRGDQGRQQTALTTLLPLDAHLLDALAARPWVSRSLPSAPLPAADLLAALIRGHLFASVFLASAEALVTENAARFALMQQAERSVDDRIAVLKSATRIARQTEITTELLDVIVGFEALKRAESKRARPAQTKVVS